MGPSFKKNQQSKTFVIKGGNQHKGRKTCKACQCSGLISWNQGLSPWEQWIWRTFRSLLRCLNAEIQLCHYRGFLLWFIEKYCGYTWKADGWLHATGFFHTSWDIIICNYRSLYTAFHHDFRRRPRYQLYLLFLPGASLPKLDVVSILVELASFCLAGRKEEPVSHYERKL